MAYAFTNSKGVTYFLHAQTRESKTPGGKARTLYFFSKEQKENAIDAVPAGYTVAEMATGLPVLKKAG